MEAVSFGLPPSSGPLPSAHNAVYEYSVRQGQRFRGLLENSALACASASVLPGDSTALFGIFEGHGSPDGVALAARVRDEFPRVLSEVLAGQLQTAAPTPADRDLGGGVPLGGVTDGLFRTLIHMDAVLQATALDPRYGRAARICQVTGAVACVAWIGHGAGPGPRCIYVANVGDVEAVVAQVRGMLELCMHVLQLMVFT
jgi:hypothetical protein